MTIFIDQETKDFGVFQTGSWWVYQNKTTLQMDTWRVIGISGGVIPANVHDNRNIDQVELKLTRSLLNDTIDLYIRDKTIDFLSAKYFGQGQVLYLEGGGGDRYGICDNLYLKVLKRDSVNQRCVLRKYAYETYPCTAFFPSYANWERHKGLKEFAYFKSDTFQLVSQRVLQ